jgi:hypothetical protein
MRIVLFSVLVLSFIGCACPSVEPIQYDMTNADMKHSSVDLNDPTAPAVFCDVDPIDGVFVRQNCSTHTTEALPCKVCSNLSGCRTSLLDPTVQGQSQAVYCVDHSFFGCEDPKCR